MKALVLFSVLAFFPMISLAATQITCAANGYSLSLNVDELKSNPPQTSYVLTKDGQKLASGATLKTSEGIHPFLKTWVWEFQSEEVIMGVALTSARTPTIGTHTGKSDLLVKYAGGYWDGTTVDCQIVIK
jgi:hypothetical protein